MIFRLLAKYKRHDLIRTPLRVALLVLLVRSLAVGQISEYSFLRRIAIVVGVVVVRINSRDLILIFGAGLSFASIAFLPK